MVSLRYQLELGINLGQVLLEDQGDRLAVGVAGVVGHGEAEAGVPQALAIRGFQRGGLEGGRCIYLCRRCNAVRWHRSQARQGA